MFELLLITDRLRQPQALAARVEAALAGASAGSVAVQLREKDLETRALVTLARDLLPLCRAHGARLLINDRLDVALALDLDGVHLPHDSASAADARRLLGPNKLVGVSCHSLAQVARAKADGASYATFGPLFETPSKQHYGPPQGLAALRAAAALGLPLFGLGGVTAQAATQVRAAGAAGLATIGAWFDAADPAAAVRALLATGAEAQAAAGAASPATRRPA